MGLVHDRVGGKRTRNWEVLCHKNTKKQEKLWGYGNRRIRTSAVSQSTYEGSEMGRFN